MQEITVIAKGLQVTTAIELQVATNVLHNLKATLAQIEATEATVTDPLKEALKAEQSRFKPFKDELKQAIEYIRSQQAIYASLRAKEQEEASKALTNGTATLEQSLQAFTPDTTDGVSFRKATKLNITDISLIPRTYLIPNEPSILEALKAGKKVKGCELEDYHIPVNRKSK